MIDVFYLDGLITKFIIIKFHYTSVFLWIAYWYLVVANIYHDYNNKIFVDNLSIFKENQTFLYVILYT